MGVFDKCVVSLLTQEKMYAFKVIVMFIRNSVLIYYVVCIAPGQQSLTLAVC